MKFTMKSPVKYTGRLLTLAVVVVLVWGVLLPSLSRSETIRNRNRWLDANGVDPAAMFYTDLPCLMADD